MTNPAVLWIRQDLRLSDHPALAAAAARGPVLFLYVLDDETPGAWRMGAASRWWLHRSLESLSRRVPLILRRGAADKVIGEVMKEAKAPALMFTRDYAPWSGGLEQRVRMVCEQAGATCRRFGGHLLHEPEAIRTGSGGPYKVYTPFSRACLATGEPRLPQPAPDFEAWRGNIASDDLASWRLLPRNPDWAQGFGALWRPGEEGARQRLRDFIDHGLAEYADGRDRPDREVTSRLSPHLHFGEISPAQCWHAVKAAEAAATGRLDAGAEKFLKEVLWREFSHHLLHHWPQLPDHPFRPEFAEFPWRDDAAALAAWQRGRTGYPIVDAGLRELWATGTMHNRARMISASFLTKHLLIDWRDGQRWFWDTLVDADLANNTAGWQWVAGCGADAAPYFRVFNPVLQGEKFDSDGDYVRRWVPELAGLPNGVIHHPWDAPAQTLSAAGVVLGGNYPHPMIVHAHARARALAAFQRIKETG